MLDHTKPYIEKIHDIDAELAGHTHKRHETAEFVWEWLLSVCCAHACQASPLWSEL